MRKVVGGGGELPSVASELKLTNPELVAKIERYLSEVVAKEAVRQVVDEIHEEANRIVDESGGRVADEEAVAAAFETVVARPVLQEKARRMVEAREEYNNKCTIAERELVEIGDRILGERSVSPAIEHYQLDLLHGDGVHDLELTIGEEDSSRVTSFTLKKVDLIDPPSWIFQLDTRGGYGIETPDVPPSARLQGHFVEGPAGRQIEALRYSYDSNGKQFGGNVFELTFTGTGELVEGTFGDGEQTKKFSYDDKEGMQAFRDFMRDKFRVELPDKWRLDTERTLRKVAALATANEKDVLAFELASD